MYDSDILLYFYSSKGNLKRSKLQNIPINIKEYLLNRYIDSESILETLFRIKNNIEIRPVCKACGKPVKFRGKSNRQYDIYCSNECKYSIYRTNEYKKTCFKKYGVDSTSKLIEVKNKQKETFFKKYGCENYLLSDDFKLKSKITCKEKYNVEFTSQIPDRIKTLKNTINNRSIDKKQEINNKIKKSKLKNNTISSQPTIIKNNLQKYGIKYTFQREDVKEKIKETNLQKYGVDHYSKTNESKQHMSIIVSSKEFQEKRNNTLKQNNTWKSSKDEKYIFNELIKIFVNVKQQYSSDVYPFNCDFYIPTLNLYIEYNGSDLHNFKPFTNSEKDKIELNNLIKKSNELKEKNNNKKTRYDNRIYTWTDLDVRKRNIAKENNINWIEFWNLNEFNNWISQYKNKEE